MGQFVLCNRVNVELIKRSAKADIASSLPRTSSPRFPSEGPSNTEPNNDQLANLYTGCYATSLSMKSVWKQAAI